MKKFILLLGASIFLLSGCMSYINERFSGAPPYRAHLNYRWQKDGYTTEMIAQFAYNECGSRMRENKLDGNPTPETVQMLAKVKSCMLANGFKPLEP